MGLGTQENKLKKEKKKLIHIPKLFFYVKSIHLRGSCRKVKKAVRRRMHAVGENEQNQSSPIQASNDYTIKGPEIRLAFTSWPRVPAQ